MSKSISITVDTKDLAKAGDWLENYAKKTLPRKVVELVSHMVRTGEKWAMPLMDHIDTGEPLYSIVGYRNGNKGVIVAGGAAVWIEFGTGVVANAGNTPHPKADELGMSAWGTYGQGKGANLDGWWYLDESGELHHTMGITGNKFMWNTAQMLKRECPQMAKEIFSK